MGHYISGEKKGHTDDLYRPFLQRASRSQPASFKPSPNLELNAFADLPPPGFMAFTFDPHEYVEDIHWHSFSAFLNYIRHPHLVLERELKFFVAYEVWMSRLFNVFNK